MSVTKETWNQSCGGLYTSNKKCPLPGNVVEKDSSVMIWAIVAKNIAGQHEAHLVRMQQLLCVKQVLCLHGYRQDANKFRQQTGALRKILKNYVEMEFLAAPHCVPGEGGSSRSWYFTTTDSFSSRDASETCTGLEESIKVIEAHWKEKGPFDGILGFSQGACLAGILAGMHEQRLISISPRFYVLIAGFMSQCKSHKHLYENKINVHSLHVFGESDEVIPYEWSKTLSEVFVNSQTLQHSGGHFVGGTGTNKIEFQSFFEQQKQNLIN